MSELKKGFWIDGNLPSDTLLPKQGSYTRKSVYGISSRIESQGEDGGLKTYLIYNFTITKNNTIKYIERLKGDLPFISPAKVDFDYWRNTSNKKEVKFFDDLVYNRKDGYSPSSTIKTFDEKGRMKYKYYKKVPTRSKNGAYTYKEYLKIEIKYPLLFGTDFDKVFAKVVEYRVLMRALLSSYHAEDRLNKLRGDKVTPEYKPEEVELLKLGKSPVEELGMWSINPNMKGYVNTGHLYLQGNGTTTSASTIIGHSNNSISTGQSVSSSSLSTLQELVDNINDENEGDKDDEPTGYSLIV